MQQPKDDHEKHDLEEGPKDVGGGDSEDDDAEEVDVAPFRTGPAGCQMASLARSSRVTESDIR